MFVEHIRIISEGPCDTEDFDYVYIVINYILKCNAKVSHKWTMLFTIARLKMNKYVIC